MAYGFRRTKLTYQLGWLSAVVALLYKVLDVIWSGAITRAVGIRPFNFLEASIVLFLISIASAQYASTYLRPEIHTEVAASRETEQRKKAA